MNWLQRKAQQYMLPFRDLEFPAYYKTDKGRVYDTPGQQGYQCAYCGRPMDEEEAQYADYWTTVDKDEAVHQTEDLRFTVDINQIRDPILRYRDAAYNYFNELVNEYRMKMGGREPFDTPIANIEREYQIQQKQQSGEEVKEPFPGSGPYIPGTYSIKNEINERFRELKSQAGVPNPFWQGYGHGQDFLPNHWGWNTLGELKGDLDRKLTDQEINEFVNKMHADLSIQQREQRRPVCEECEDDLDTCDWCSEKIGPGIMESTTYTDADTVDGNGATICEKCHENGEGIEYCQGCQRVFLGEDYMGEYMRYTEDGAYCTDCAAPPADLDQYQGLLETEDLDDQSYFPADPKDINKVLIPFWQFINEKFPNTAFDEDGRSKILAIAKKRNLKGHHLNQIGFMVSKYNNPEECLQALDASVRAQKEFTDAYPGIKGLRQIPAQFAVEESYGQPDVTSFTIIMRPGDMLKQYAEALFPGAKAMWDELSRGGHHNRAMAYCRIGVDGKDWTVDNLQTDSDVQGLSDYERAKYEKINEMIQRGQYRYNNGQWTSKQGKQYVPVDESVANHSEEQIQQAQAYSFWNRTMKHWPVMLLHVAKVMAESDGSNLHVTSYAMQQNKWNRVPERNRDVYDRIPRMMDGKEVDWSGKPETLPYNNYKVVQMAELEALIKIAQQQQGPGIAALANWFFSVGGSPQMFSQAWKNNALPALLTMPTREPPFPNVPVVNQGRNWLTDRAKSSRTPPTRGGD